MFLLSIQALEFELGNDLSKRARSNLDAANSFVEQLLGDPDLGFWLECETSNL